MRIAILDGYSLNPGDLSWEQFQALGECVIYDRTPPEMTLTRAAGADMIITNKVVLSREIINQLPDLKYIGVTATGYNVVDTLAAAERGIPVTNVPGYGTQAVVQMVFAHILDFTNLVAQHSAAVRDGKWSRCKDFCFWEHPLMELSGKTMGIVGLGRIGSAVAAVALAFGMRVLACNPGRDPKSESSISLTDLETVFRESDVVSLHCPLKDGNRGFVNASLLKLMKPTALFINTGRGPLVDEAALADALNSGTLAGAGLDVLAAEPPSADCPLLTAKNCHITPHIAWASTEARQRLMTAAAQNASSFMRGKIVNAVNGM